MSGFVPKVVGELPPASSLSPRGRSLSTATAVALAMALANRGKWVLISEGKKGSPETKSARFTVLKKHGAKLAERLGDDGMGRVYAMIPAEQKTDEPQPPAMG